MPTLPDAAAFERLLTPVSAAARAGVSLRYEGTYDRVREARREDDPSLPQGVWTTKLKVADWGAVAAICTEAIERRSKDLQLGAWLAEAWAHLHGFAGVSLGVELATALLDRYWDDGFPALEDGAEARAGLIEWLDDVLSRQIRQTPLIEADAVAPAYRLLDWEAGAEPGRGAGRDADDRPAPAISQEAFLARLSLLGAARWQELRKSATSGVAATEHLEAMLAGRMQDAPVLRRTREALRAILRLARSMPGAAPAPAEGKGEGVEIGMAGTADTAGMAGTAGSAGSAGAAETGAGDSLPALRGPIKSRAEAYLRLSEAADYLLRTEPHSPVPYLVKRAVSWGNMSLAELLYEFVQSPDDLVTIQRLLGMRGKDE